MLHKKASHNNDYHAESCVCNICVQTILIDGYTVLLKNSSLNTWEVVIPELNYTEHYIDTPEEQIVNAIRETITVFNTPKNIPNIPLPSILLPTLTKKRIDQLRILHNQVSSILRVPNHKNPVEQIEIIKQLCVIASNVWSNLQLAAIEIKENKPTRCVYCTRIHVLSIVCNEYHDHIAGVTQ